MQISPSDAQTLKILTPFVYGALGACVYLLRSLHEHIYDRSFDRRHKGEYYNRILLGTISGGILVLLFPLPKDGTAVIGDSAVAFLAGYNTDLLFSAIERVTAAVLPKTAPTPPTVVKAPAPTPPPPGP
ncbi:MAG TPA: hypothetical protein VGG48_19795 [Rhizomicrobium sp.]|jgi:hypothetical protein